MLDSVQQVAYASGYNAGKTRAAEKVKEAFKGLPANADSATKDLLLDLYNEVMEVATVIEE